MNVQIKHDLFIYLLIILTASSSDVIKASLSAETLLIGWLHSTVGRTPVFGRRTDRPALGLQPMGDHYVGKPSAAG